MKILRHLYTGLALMALTVSLGACTDDDLTMGQQGEDVMTEIEGDCLQFTVKLDKDLSSRGDNFSSIEEKYDNYIDTQDKFRVFFFTVDGDFLFGATDRVVGSLSSTDNNADYWYVRIPMTMIVDRENQEYDIDKIKTYLKNNPFKIAVLANWPNAGEKVNPADWDDSEGTPDGSENPSSTLKGHPLWNWNNSILNKDAHPDSIRNINDLHHVYKDSYYGDATSNGVTSRLQAYSKFMENISVGADPGYYMGEPTDWVKMRDVEDGWGNAYHLNSVVKDFSSKTTANQWIRANWSPKVEYNSGKKIYRHYQHMWFLWNFDASFKYGQWLEDHPEATEEEKKNMADSFYGRNWDWNDGSPVAADKVNSFGTDWFERNGTGYDSENRPRLYPWMKRSYNAGKTPVAIGTTKIEIGGSNSDVFFQYMSLNGSPAYCVNVNGNYGIQLPALGTGQKVDYNGMITFQARTSGTLRIKWSSAEVIESGLAVQVGLPKLAGNATNEIIYKEDGNVRSTTPRNWTDSDGTQYLDITISESSRPVYIFATKGKPVVYSVEFIRGRYLYETDREGVAPGPLQGIPMYGVQDYPAVSDWQRGTTFNLSGNVSLVRALAKVEFYIKNSFGKPKHVIMRGINRAARCEPMDVFTPTDRIWGNDDERDHNSNHPTYPASAADLSSVCEWFRIQQYGVYYQGNKDYTDWLSWFYGSWKYDSGDENTIKWKKSSGYRYDRDLGYFVADGQEQGWPDMAGYATPELPSPRIFNPYIYRSDFCRFLEVGDTYVGQDHYYKYVLYLPEKNIDDPTVVGDNTSNPKVAHIEYRFIPDEADVEESDLAGVADDDFANSEYNLDDNDCFRVYFTNYGADQSGSNGPVNTEITSGYWYRETYDEYKQSADRIKYHWPIMRNHKYKLYVAGSSPKNPEIRVQVTDWSHRKVIVEW